MSEKKLFIIDGHAYAYRAFYAIRELKSPATGAPTNAIYGFIRMLAKMTAAIKPTHMIVVWDGGLSDYRTNVLPEYKIQRAPMPPALEAQLEEIADYLRASNIASFVQEGIEADDWIATLCHHAVKLDFYVVIASADKDFLQLISPKIGILNPNDREPRIWTAENVRQKTGVNPENIVDWLALVGDSVDNISGVPGVGTATAARLLQQFGSVEGLFGRINEVNAPKLRENLQRAKDIVFRNRDLVRLHTDLHGVECCDGLEVRTPDLSKLKQLYSSWGFKTLLAEVERQIDETHHLL